MDDKSSKNVYGKYGISGEGERMICGVVVVVVVKCNTFRWFDNLYRDDRRELMDKEDL